MSEISPEDSAAAAADGAAVVECENNENNENNENTTSIPSSLDITTSSSMNAASGASKIPTPASSITGIPVSKLKLPLSFGSTSSVSKIGRPCCTHATPKTGPPPRDTNSMSRESDDNLSSINSTYTDLYQETVKRFTRSSLSPTIEWDRFSPSRRSLKSTGTSGVGSSIQQKSDNERRGSYDYYLEATGRRRSSDHGAVLTADTEQFIIGQRVWVGGVRSGQIAYIGETHFAPGEWAGIVLDEPNGKNDGCVAGKRYFQCEAKRGIFSRLTRLTLVPLAGAMTPTSPLSKNSPERSRTVSPTASIRSSMLRSPGTGKNGLTVGDRVIVSSGFGSRPGILRYLGETQFAPGNWCGVELDESSGKNDGAVDGVRYFECKPKYGVFVPIAKVSLSPSTKKTRLSRTGSRESLTSIGTMNSIATTNTSRMRMNAQRKSNVSLLLKPVTSPKSQFSMQDLLRDKQNHIEQLMIERDLDREDSQNQALQLQKNINELKARIVQLEAQLFEERKKSEELQFSIDEATFCGDELNAQTQVYKEKIHDLENQISDLLSESPRSKGATPEELVEELEEANAKIFEMKIKITELEHYNESCREEQTDEEQRLIENVKYLRSQNDMLQKELVEKDASLEKFSLSQVGIENLRKELALLREENNKQAEQASAEFHLKLNEKSAELKRVNEELNQLKSTLETLENERLSASDEAGVLQIEVKSRDEQLQQLTQQVDELTMQLSVQKAESSALDELLKAQQVGSEQGKSTLTEKEIELVSLKATNEQLEKTKAELEQQLQQVKEEVNRLCEHQQMLVQKLQEAEQADLLKSKAFDDFEIAMGNVKIEITSIGAENAKLKMDLQQSHKDNEQAKDSLEKLERELQSKREEFTENIAKQSAQLTEELKTLKQASTDEKSASDKKVELLNAELAEIKERLSLLQNQSATNADELNSKAAELVQVRKKHEEELAGQQTLLTEEHSKHTELKAKHEAQRQDLRANKESLETTTNTLEKLAQEHEAAKATCKALEAQLKSSEEAKAQHDLELGDLARKHEALNLKCTQLATQNETLQADVLAAHALAAEHQGTLKKLNDEIAAKQKAQTEFESHSNAERLSRESELHTLKLQLSNAEKDYAELKDSSNKANDELYAKKSHITTLEEQTVKQELAIGEAKRLQDNLQARYDALVAQHDDLQKNLTTLRTSSTDSNTELLKLSQDNITKQKAYEELVEKSGGERAALEGQLQASQQRIDTLCNQVETLTLELKSVTEEGFQRFEQLKAAEEQSGKQALTLGDLGRKFEAQTAQCEKVAQENAKLQLELNAALTSNTDANAKLVSLNEKLALKQKELVSQTDKDSAERLQFESQVQELNQRLQTTQTELDSLRAELVAATEAKSLQVAEFANLKAELSTKSRSELEETKTLEAAEREKLMSGYETRLKQAEQAKTTLDDTVSGLQAQLQQAQSEFSKAQLEASAKEKDLHQQLETHTLEKSKLNEALQQLQNERSAEASNAAHAQAELEAKLLQAQQELKDKLAALQNATTEGEQLKLQQANTSGDLVQLQAKIKELEETLELTRTEVAHRVQVAREDAEKMDDLRTLLDTVKQSHASMSATNAELSATLEVLEAERCETSHVFELFEMESDRNADNLLKKLTGMKQELADTHAELVATENRCLVLESNLTVAQADLRTVHQAMGQQRDNSAALSDRLRELEQANEELHETLKDNDFRIVEEFEFNAKLAEYKEIIDEIDEQSTAKTIKLQGFQKRFKDLEQTLKKAYAAHDCTKDDFNKLTRKLESVQLEKSREIQALQTKLDEAERANPAGGDSVEPTDMESNLAHINFLNSIIADMQKKNETLKSKIDALEALPTDFTKPHAFDMFNKRKPAPRVFCDICDEFDKHETEDCPLQASEDLDGSPPPSNRENNNNNDEKKERKLPAPRKYCETCEVFGHATGECADDETY